MKKTLPSLQVPPRKHEAAVRLVNMRMVVLLALTATAAAVLPVTMSAFSVPLPLDAIRVSDEECMAMHRQLLPDSQLTLIECFSMPDEDARWFPELTAGFEAAGFTLDSQVEAGDTGVLQQWHNVSTRIRVLAWSFFETGASDFSLFEYEYIEQFKESGPGGLSVLNAFTDLL